MQATILQRNTNQEDKIFEIVDRVLKQIFGKEATQLIYRYLENHHSLKPTEISNRIDVFAKGLEEFLDSGACVIERRILEDIYASYGLLRRIELARMREGHDFVTQVRLLSRRA